MNKIETKSLFRIVVAKSLPLVLPVTSGCVPTPWVPNPTAPTFSSPAFWSSSVTLLVLNSTFRENRNYDLIVKFRSGRTLSVNNPRSKLLGSVGKLESVLATIMQKTAADKGSVNSVNVFP